MKLFEKQKGKREEDGRRTPLRPPTPPLPPYKHEERWKATPAKLDSAAVFHLPQQIAGMIAEHVPASRNEVQMHQVISATHHHGL